MSEPVTNVEIEDVLSSIRRLVTESGGKPVGNDVLSERTIADSDVKDAAEQEAETLKKAPLEKLVLTPSLRVAGDEAEQTSDVPVDASEPDAMEALTTESHAEQGDDASEEQSEDSLKGRIEHLETVVADQSQDWEDDVEADGNNAGQPFEPLQWEDHNDVSSPDKAAMFVAPQPEGATEADIIEDNADVDGTSIEDASNFDFLSDDTVIDEEMLREMVADIVRQELQGALGERITRNVRKLVRREIHRALLAQELE